MKKILISFCIVSLLLLACDKTNNSQMSGRDISTDYTDGMHEIGNNEDDASVYIPVEIQMQEDLNRTMYVNATSGLRVRDLPSLDGKRIGLLEHITEVNILGEDNNVVTINDIEGRWVYINAPIEGWVFDGFLSQELPLLQQPTSQFSIIDDILSFIGNPVPPNFTPTPTSGHYENINYKEHWIGLSADTRTNIVVSASIESYSETIEEANSWLTQFRAIAENTNWVLYRNWEGRIWLYTFRRDENYLTFYLPRHLIGPYVSPDLYGKYRSVISLPTDPDTLMR